MTTLNTTDRYTELGYTYKEGATGPRAGNHHNKTNTYTQKQRRNRVSYIVRFTRTRIQMYKLILDDTCMVILLYRKGTITKSFYCTWRTLQKWNEARSTYHHNTCKK